MHEVHVATSLRCAVEHCMPHLCEVSFVVQSDCITVLFCFGFFFLVYCKNITSSIVFTAMDNSASLSKVGGRKFIHSQSHEIVFLVHRFG